jgi:acyl-CoA hydrolase/RimJ/RimL family protein N-acetyltransferase
MIARIGPGSATRVSCRRGHASADRFRTIRGVSEVSDWRTRAVPAAQAVAAVRPGARVFVGSACGTPRTLLAALEARPDEPAGVELVHYLTDGATGLRDDGRGSAFRHRAWYVGSDMRELARHGEVEYVPISVAEVPRLLDIGRIGFDVAFVQVAPPDADGQCSLGVAVDVTRASALAAGHLVAEVNPAMPRTGVDSTIPLDRIGTLVAVDTPVIEYVHPDVGQVAGQIARYVARLIPDAATLQVGLGRIPNEMLRYLEERRGLRVHSDVLTDGILDLIERGVVTGPVVGSMAMGTRRLYDHIDGNPGVTLEPIERVADPSRLASLPALVSVTQAFGIDLSGQVSAERLDGDLYGGLAGQADFHRAATRSSGGRPIVCLASTHADGGSAIRVTLDPGEPVSIARGDVHWVVTEYGVAHLHGRSLAERAVALLEIAHPDHRERLLADAAAAGILSPRQALRSRTAYPVGEESVAELRDGRQVAIRPTRTTDARPLQDLFFRMRPEDVRTRFFRSLRSLTDEMAQHLCSVGYEQEMAFAAVVGDRESERIVGTASYFLDPSSGMADVAYMVDPEWQGSGLGSALQARAIAYARAHGVRGFTADVLAENAGMIAVFRRSGLRLESHRDAGAFEVRMYFD